MTLPNEPDLPNAVLPGHEELAGKSAVVTGATEGIGFHTARLLASRGATVLITGRDPARGSAAVTAIRQAARHPRVEFMPVDHSTAGANEQLATALIERFGRLDVLVNNVGGIFARRLVSADGFEMSLALNFLAPFVLTEALLPLLARGPGAARCVNVVSSSFQMTKGDPFGDLQAQRDYTGIFVHGRAKLFTLLWSMGLSHRVPASQMVVTAVNPGMAWTSMTQSLTPEVVPAWRHIMPVVRFFQRRADPVKAALNCERLVTAGPDTIEGRYFDGTKPKTLPPKFADPGLPDRVQAIGTELRAAAATAGALSDTRKALASPQEGPAMTLQRPGDRDAPKIVVFGATGPAGQRIVSRALEEGYRIVAAARHPAAAWTGRPEVEVVSADVADPGADLDPLIKGAAGVLSALGSRGRQPTTVYSAGIRRIAEAMGRQQVRRVICISSDGIDIPPGLPWPQRVVMAQVIQRLYRHQYADMARMEAYLDSVPLDWTVIRAPRLTDGAPTGHTRVSLDQPILDGGSLRRADLADFMLEALDRPDTYRRRVHLASPRK